MNKLYHAVTDNLKNYNDQSNEAINSEPKFDNSSFNLSSVTCYPLSVVTVSLQGEKKHRETVVASLTCLWDSGYTNSMIKIQHTKHYERKMRSNRVDYITAAGVYCTTHYVQVPFFMPEFSVSNIINHHFHFDNNKGESDLGYDMIIVRYLMVQLGLTADFKRQVIQWDGATVHMKEPISLLG